jgi:hypothetical protein
LKGERDSGVHENNIELNSEGPGLKVRLVLRWLRVGANKVAL